MNVQPGAHRSVSRVRNPRSILTVLSPPNHLPYRHESGHAPQPAGCTVARFALSSEVKPQITAALSVGDRVRSALLHLSDGHPIFVGRDADGRVAQGHGHAWFLPSDDDADGLIDHVVVHVRGGFDPAAVRALQRLRWVWGHDLQRVELVMTGLGAPEDLGCVGRAPGSATRSPQLGESRIWESLTPFVPPRHTKVRGGILRDAPGDQVTRLLEARGLPGAIINEIAPHELAPPAPAQPIAWDHFQRLRARGGGSRASSQAFGFRLRFPQPVRGPIAVGYASHQGLGQFIAVAE
jgi:CRISPR-associated protein Csb2